MAAARRGSRAPGRPRALAPRIARARACHGARASASRACHDSRLGLADLQHLRAPLLLCACALQICFASAVSPASLGAARRRDGVPSAQAACFPGRAAAAGRVGAAASLVCAPRRPAAREQLAGARGRAASGAGAAVRRGGLGGSRERGEGAGPGAGACAHAGVHARTRCASLAALLRFVWEALRLVWEACDLYDTTPGPLSGWRMPGLQRLRREHCQGLTRRLHSGPFLHCTPRLQ